MDVRSLPLFKSQLRRPKWVLACAASLLHKGLAAHLGQKKWCAASPFLVSSCAARSRVWAAQPPSFLSQLRSPNPLRAAQPFLMPLQTRTTAWRGPSPHLKKVKRKKGTYLRGVFLSLSARLPSLLHLPAKGG